MDVSVKEDLKFWDGTEDEYKSWKTAQLKTNMSYFEYPSPHYMIPVNVGSQRALVDEDIADVVHLLWTIGIRTTSSCAGGPRKTPFAPDFTPEEIEEWADGEDEDACLGFPSEEDFRRFVTIVAPPDETAGSLTERMTGGFRQTDYDDETGEAHENYPDKLRWGWRLYPPRWLDGKLTFSIIADFDPVDIPEIRKRLTAQTDKETHD